MAYEIKLASFSDIKLMIDLAASIGWNPGVDDAFAFQQIDPSGFFIGFLNDKLIACISNVKHSNEFYFLGFYIVKPEYRGKGFGMKIWDHALAYANNANIGLDSVFEQKENYMKSGFKPAHINERYCLKQNTIHSFQDARLVNAESYPMIKILEYDQDFFPFSRRAFLISWILAPNNRSLVFVDKGAIKGYGVLRKCRQGYKIGPLFADDVEVANCLYQGLCAIAPRNESIFLDIPQPNTAASFLIEQYNLEKVFATVRMYTKDQPDIALHRTFGLTTFEIG